MVDISTGQARLEKLDGEADSYVLHVNGVPSSSITLSDPQRLDFEYLDWMRRIIDVELPHRTLRAAHIGAAGCALARALNSARPGSKQTAIDIDAKLLDFARDWFDLPRSPALALRAGDGAVEIGKFRADTLDVLVRDAFDHDSVPTTLQTFEFFTSCAEAVKDSGLYVANVPDPGDHRLLRAELRGLGEHFAHLAAATEPAILKGRRRGNVVVLASHSELDTAGLDRSLRTAASSATFLAGTDLRSRLGI
ncbi:fused MFS/spermidine synthase [Brevibacterium sp. 'Marine']|uniref:spermidine synthase n=1 Tax=Brevibacterium sp. 'Marine' TaxID=2725563 RepID=UPI002006E0E8|nr:fused MFS/spermidine synthase [Brevibacterium sp. 'Marine']